MGTQAKVLSNSGVRLGMFPLPYSGRQKTVIATTWLPMFVGNLGLFVYRWILQTPFDDLQFMFFERKCFFDVSKERRNMVFKIAA